MSKYLLLFFTLSIGFVKISNAQCELVVSNQNTIYGSVFSDTNQKRLSIDLYIVSVKIENNKTKSPNGKILHF